MVIKYKHKHFFNQTANRTPANWYEIYTATSRNYGIDTWKNA